MKTRRIMLTIASAVFFIISISILLFELCGMKSAHQAQSIKHVSYSLTAQADHSVDYDYYTGINADVYGILSLPETSLTTPVVMSSPTTKYYRKNLSGEWDVNGVPYIGSGNEPGAAGTNCTVFGHRLDDGTQFGLLEALLDSDYRQQHNTLVFETQNGTQEWSVVAVFPTDISKDSYAYEEMTDVGTDAGYGAWYNWITQRDENAVLTQGAAYLTLSTCYYPLGENGRLVVICSEKSA